MKITRKLRNVITYLFSVSTLILVGCSDDDNPENTRTSNSKFLVSAEIDGEGYYTLTESLNSGRISIVGNGAEGYANLSITADGYFYNINSDEGTLDKFEITDNGMVKIDAISTTTLLPGSFYRHIQATSTGDLFLSNFPNQDNEAPYAIIDLESFTVSNHGFFEVPQVDDRDPLWINGVVQDDKIYFGSWYGDRATYSNYAESLITVQFDYPSLTNPKILTNDVSAGSLSGYRTNGSFITENGDIYQYNLNSIHWNENDELAGRPTVFVRIKNGEYDDYTLNVSENFSEPIAIWNAWYAGDNIVYANVVREGDIAEWGDLSANTGTIVKINLETQSVTELNIPKAPYVNLFQLDCIVENNFYIPVSINGGEANIYQIDIEGGANDFTKGAVLDGSNVFVNALHRIR